MNRVLFFAAVIGMLLAGQAHGQSYTYTVENSKATITGFSAEPSGAIVVPATLGGGTVTEIGRAAFKDRTLITSISFAAPASVTKIGATAFQGCSGLQTISLPTGITSISPGLLQGCTSLTSVTIPTTITSIGDAAFGGCRSLTTLTLPAALTSLGDSAFSDCRSLTSLTIPSGVTSIPGQLLNECRALTSLNLPASITQIGYAAFNNCAGLTSFTLPTGVTSIARDAFKGCSGLTSFAINAALGAIGDRALLGCNALGSITVEAANPTYSSLDGVLFNKAQTALLLCPAGRSGSYSVPATVVSLARESLAHCRGLTSVTIAGGVTSIGDDAFYYATALTSVVIPESVSSIGAWAFAGSGLLGVTIPASVSSVGNDAFHYCAALTYTLFNGNAPLVGSAVFDNVGTGFSIYYYAGQSGFSSPTWLEYPAAALNVPPAIVSWLTGYGLSPGTPILSDPNNDGVSFLIAYALGLDPTLSLASSLPLPVVTTSGSQRTLSMTFYGNAEAIIYTPEISSDLRTWTTGGVILSAPDARGLRTASATADNLPALFMRLRVGFEREDLRAEAKR